MLVVRLKTNGNRSGRLQKAETATKYERRVPGGGEGIDIEFLVQMQTFEL